MKLILISFLSVLVFYAQICKCQDVSATVCKTSGDCKDGYCCVNPDRPIGKRQEPAFTCQPRGLVNGGCLVRYPVFNPTYVYYRCPCADGLYCKGNGIIDVPLGEMGNCTPN